MAKEYLTVNGRLVTVDGRLVQVPDSGNLNDLADENGNYALQGTLLADDIINLIANGVVDGSPRAVYGSLTDLQTAYPNGANGVYLTSDNGHWYYWNGTAWTDGGAYCTNESFKGYSVLVIDNDGNVVRHFIDDTIGAILSNYDSSVGTATAIGNMDYPILLRGTEFRPKYSYGSGVKEIALLEDVETIVKVQTYTIPLYGLNVNGKYIEFNDNGKSIIADMFSFIENHTVMNINMSAAMNGTNILTGYASGYMSTGASALGVGTNLQFILINVTGSIGSNGSYGEIMVKENAINTNSNTVLAFTQYNVDMVVNIFYLK